PSASPVASHSAARGIAMKKTLVRSALVAILLLLIGLIALNRYRFLLGHASADDWTVSLREAAAGADRVVVRDRNFHGKGALPDVEVSGSEKVRELLDLIEIDARNSGFHCMCDGEYWIHLYRGEQEVLSLGYHHARSLRWHRGRWQGDGLL